MSSVYYQTLTVASHINCVVARCLVGDTGAMCYIRISKNMTSYISSQTLRSKQVLDPSYYLVDSKQIRTFVTIFQDINAFSDTEVNFQNIFNINLVSI